MRYDLLNGANLAYIGDAYYELVIRKYLIDKGVTKNHELKKKSLKFLKIFFQYPQILRDIKFMMKL